MSNGLNPTTINDLWGRLLRDTFGDWLSDEDAFLVFVLLHSYRIVLVENVLIDRPGISVVDADTQRGVASSLASMWANTNDPRADYIYWYYLWNGDWRGSEHAENLTEEEQMRFAALRTTLEQHPFVVRFELEN